MPMATFSQPYITMYVYEKDYLIPKLCIRQIICPCHTQFRYQLVLFIYIYGWLKVATGIFYLGKTSPQVLPRQKMPMATFSQPYITMYVYEKDYLIPKLCIRQIICPCHTQFRYQLVLFIYIYGWLKVATGIFYLGKTSPQVLPRQKMPMATFSQPYITMYVYEKDYLIPKLCIRQIICPCHTQFKYQLVLFIHIYGWLKVAFGIFFLGKLAVGIF